jgi:hypothetical protein
MGDMLSGLEYGTEHVHHCQDRVSSTLEFTHEVHHVSSSFSIVSRQTNRHFASSHSIPLARAFIESSLMSWITLAVYTGLYTADNIVCNLAYLANAPH